jgi:hypothetical protein
MNPSALVLISGVVVVGSRWATGKTVTAKIVIGGLVTAFGVAVIAEADIKLATLFAALILTGVLLTDGVAFFKKMGFGG